MQIRTEDPAIAKLTLYVRSDINKTDQIFLNKEAAKSSLTAVAQGAKIKVEFHLNTFLFLHLELA